MHDKLAFLFLTYDTLEQPAIWQTFFGEGKGRYSIYHHPKSGKSATAMLAPYVIAKHTLTEYGRVSLVRAMLYLLEAALADESNRLFVFVSGACIPTCRFPVFYEALMSRGRSRVTRGPDHMNRYPTVDRSVIPRAHYYKTSQWVVLTRPHAQICLAGPLEAYANSIVPDEHYFVTTLSMAGIDFAKEVDEREIVYAEWAKIQGRTRPRTHSRIPLAMVSKIRAEKRLTARKFDSSPAVYRDWFDLTSVMTLDVVSM